MFSRPKVVYDPLRGVIDIDSIQPMVDTPEFQRLRELLQLSFTYIAFPAARHTRFEHSIGSCSATRRIADRWVKQGSIDAHMRRALMGFALYHDIGHAAFSHAAEDFCGDHKDQTVLIIDGLRAEIEACDIDFALLRSLATHENSLHLAVSDKNVGMEKLDYLERDGWYTGIGFPSGVDYLRKFMYLIDGKIAVDEKMVDHVIDTMNFYMQMYKNVYLRKSLVIAQRTFHKLLYYLVTSGELDPRRLQVMTDGELVGFIALSKHPGATNLYQRLRQRRLFKEAVSIRTEECKAETRVAEKSINVLGLSDEDMRLLTTSPNLQKSKHLHLETAEMVIATAIGLEPAEVLVVPAFYADRFVSTDVNIFEGGGRLGSLKQRRPEAFKGMEETARVHKAIRICVPEEHRRRAADAARDILSILYESA